MGASLSVNAEWFISGVCSELGVGSGEKRDSKGQRAQAKPLQGVVCVPSYVSSCHIWKWAIDLERTLCLSVGEERVTTAGWKVRAPVLTDVERFGASGGPRHVYTLSCVFHRDSFSLPPLVIFSLPGITTFSPSLGRDSFAEYLADCGGPAHSGRRALSGVWGPRAFIAFHFNQFRPDGFRDLGSCWEHGSRRKHLSSGLWKTSSLLSHFIWAEMLPHLFDK